MNRLDNPICDAKELEARVAKMDYYIERLRKDTVWFRSAEAQTPAEMATRDGREEFADARGLLRSTHEHLQYSLGARETFHAALQQYHLPPKLRREVEDGARLYARQRALSPRTPAATKEAIELMVDLHDALVRSMRETPSEACSVEGKHADRFLQAGPFRLVNTGGFDAQTMETVQGAVVEAAARLQKLGLDCLLYGDVFVSNQIAAKKVAAFYYAKSDELFVRADKKILANRAHVVWTIAHELAHRFDFRFLRDSRRAVPPDLWKVYRAVQRSEENCAPVPGETLSVQGADYEVVGWKYGLPELRSVQVKKVSDPAVVGFLQLDAYCAHQKRGFVTAYARRGAGGSGSAPEENFAEMIAADAMGMLPEWQAQLLVPIMEVGIAKAEAGIVRSDMRLDNPAKAPVTVVPVTDPEARKKACRKVNQGTHWIREERRHAIYLRDDYRCAYCRFRDPTRTGKRMSLDHLVPCDSGGTNVNENLVTACGPCNSTKKAMSRHAFYDYLVTKKAKTAAFIKEIHKEIEKRIATKIDRGRGEEFAERAKRYRDAHR